MKKLFLALLSNVLMVFIPLSAKPALIVNGKIIFLIIGSVAIWLTQPALSFSETNEKKQSDKHSVLLILLMSFLSVAVPVIDWAYFHADQNAITWVTILGAVMIITGIAFRAWAVQTLGKYFTPTVQIKSEHRLIDNGPYSIVRHPSYFGAFITITAGALLLNSWIGFAFACIAMTAAYYVRIGIEERELVAHFGDRYRSYMLKTKKIIPFIW